MGDITSAPSTGGLLFTGGVLLDGTAADRSGAGVLMGGEPSPLRLRRKPLRFDLSDLLEGERGMEDDVVRLLACAC